MSRQRRRFSGRRPRSRELGVQLPRSADAFFARHHLHGFSGITSRSPVRAPPSCYPRPAPPPLQDRRDQGREVPGQDAKAQNRRARPTADPSANQPCGPGSGQQVTSSSKWSCFRSAFTHRGPSQALRHDGSSRDRLRGTTGPPPLSRGRSISRTDRNRPFSYAADHGHHQSR